MRHGCTAGREACATSGGLYRCEFGFIVGENTIDPLLVESQRGEFLRVSEPRFGAGSEPLFGGHIPAKENLIFDQACAGQSPRVENDGLREERLGGAFGREGGDQVVVINIELGRSSGTMKYFLLQSE